MRTRLLLLLLPLCFIIALTPAPGIAKEKKANDTITALFYSGKAEVDARPEKPIWRKAKAVTFQHDWRGDLLVGNETAVWAAWTQDELWLLFRCGYDTLTISPDPQSTKETDRLWAISDVAEAFIAPNPADIMRYKEFQVSPATQWVDLDIDRESKRSDMSWNSGFRVAARVDSMNQIWWGEMAIPLKAFGVAPPGPGSRWRLNFFRFEQGPPKRAIAWQPTHTPTPNFHVPQSFGWIEFKLK